MFARLKLLVVEDFLPFRRVLSSLLSGAGVDIIGETSDGLNAVRLAQELKPDLILLDIALPGLDGISAGRQIRELCPHSKIVFVSQESSTDMVQEAFALGAGAYVHKSHAQNDLLAAIEAVLKGDRFASPSLAFDDATVQPPLRHDILFCSDDSAIVDNVASFISTALRAGDPAVVWATEAHRESLLRALQAQDIDTEATIQNGMFLPLDVNDPPHRTLEVIMSLKGAASQMGRAHSRIAAYGERAGILWAQGKTDEAIRVEQLCNEIAKSHGIDILCLYPMPENDTALDSICAEHTRVYSLP